MRQPTQTRLAPVDEPVVHPAGPALPELHDLGPHAVAAPLLGHRHLVGVGLLGLGVRRVELGPRGDHPGLVGGVGAEAGAAWPAREVRRHVGRRQHLRRPLDADLAFQRVPGEQQRTARLGRELLALARAQVGEEHEPLVGEALEQDHPRRRLAVGRRPWTTTIAFGSYTPASRTSSNHRPNIVTGSAARSPSVRPRSAYSRRSAATSSGPAIRPTLGSRTTPRWLRKAKSCHKTR